MESKTFYHSQTESAGFVTNMNRDMFSYAKRYFFFLIYINIFKVLEKNIERKKSSYSYSVYSWLLAKKSCGFCMFYEYIRMLHTNGNK